MSYPAFVNGEPPVISLADYDGAEWAATTCVDMRDGGFVVVVMQNPDQVVARIRKEDDDVLMRIFRSAHETHQKQSN